MNVFLSGSECWNEILDWSTTNPLPASTVQSGGYQQATTLKPLQLEVLQRSRPPWKARMIRKKRMIECRSTPSLHWMDFVHCNYYTQSTPVVVHSVKLLSVANNAWCRTSCVTRTLLEFTGSYSTLQQYIAAIPTLCWTLTNVKRLSAGGWRSPLPPPCYPKNGVLKDLEDLWTET